MYNVLDIKVLKYAVFISDKENWHGLVPLCKAHSCLIAILKHNGKKGKGFP